MNHVIAPIWHARALHHVREARRSERSLNLRIARRFIRLGMGKTLAEAMR